MKQNAVTKKEFLDFFYSLPVDEALEITEDYDRKHKTLVSEELKRLKTDNSTGAKAESCSTTSITPSRRSAGNGVLRVIGMTENFV